MGFDGFDGRWQGIVVAGLVLYSYLFITQSISNYKMFDLFNTKFDYSFYLKTYGKYYFLLWFGLLIKILEG